MQCGKLPTGNVTRGLGLSGRSLVALCRTGTVGARWFVLQLRRHAEGLSSLTEEEAARSDRSPTRCPSPSKRRRGVDKV